MANYEQLRRAGFQEGQVRSFSVYEATLDGKKERVVHESIERFAGGGFHGGVLILKDSVIKTATPDPLHEFARRMNWPVPFPLRSSETAAELADIAGKILHLTVPPLTDHKVITPSAQGYVDLGQELGYGLLIEKMKGRGASFKDGGEENRQIQHAREQVWELRNKIGAEHTAQVHPDNPFGKPNMWIGQDGESIWLDYLPAILHTGKVKPWYKFNFHYDVQGEFRRKPTFDKLHTQRLRDTLRTDQSKFSTTDLQVTRDLIDLYDERWEKHEDWLSSDPQTLFIQDALKRGHISSEYAEKLAASKTRFDMYQTSELAGVGLEAFWDIVKDSPANVTKYPEFARNVAKFLFNSEYRAEQVMNKTTLWGMKKAHENGFLTDEEFENALSFVPVKEMAMYVNLQLFYLINSRVTDLITISAGTTAVLSDAPILGGLMVLANIFTPGIVRGVTTLGVGKLNGINLNKAAAIATLPTIGTVAAIPLQLRDEYGELGEDIVHYTKRGLIAKATSIRPWGGWNSDLEEDMWEKVNFYEEKVKERSGLVQGRLQEFSGGVRKLFGR